MIFKQETIKSWLTGVGSSINNEMVQPFKNANSIISKYNLAIQHNSLTQQGWQRLLAQSDESLKAYLTSIKGTTAFMSGYNVSLQGNITGFTKITKAMQQYNALGATSQKEQQAFATVVGATNTKLGSYLTGLNGAKASLSGYGLSLIASTAKTIGLTVATTALNATLTMGISLIVSGLISAFVSWIHKSEEITEKAQEAADKINSINDSLKSNTETVENAKKRYAELAQEVGNLGKITQSQGTLSNAEYEEFLDLSNQLAGIFPSLTKNYDENGNAILDLSGDVNTIVGSLDSLIQKEKELANQKIMEEFPDVFKGWNQNLSDAEQKVKSAKTEFDKINNAYQQLSKGSAVQAFEDYGNGALKGYFLDENGKKIPIDYQEYIQAAKDLELEIKETDIKLRNQFGGEYRAGIRVELTGDIDTAFTSKLEKAREDLQYAQQQLEGQTPSINQYLNTWLQSEFSYIQIEDSGLQTAIQDMLFNFDWDNIPEDKRGDWNYVSEYFRRNILFEINKVQNNPVISKALSEVFTNAELSPDEKANYLQQITDFFGEDSAVVIALKPQIELQKQYDKVIEDTKDKFDGYDPTKFFKKHSINTQEEIDAWQEIAQGARDAAEAEKEYLNQGREQGSTPTLSITETIDQLNTQLKPAFDSLSSAWNNIFTLDGNNREIFSLDSVNTDMLYSIQDAISKINAVEGVSIDLSSYENLAKVLGNPGSNADDVKNSFNELASSIIDGVSVTKGFNDQTKNLCAQLLKETGIINADQIVLEKLNQSKIQQKAASIDFSDATADEIRNLTAYGEELGFTSQQVYGLYLQQLLVNDDPLQTKSSILQLIGLCQAGSETADTLVDLYDIMVAISKGRQKLANGELTAAQAEVTKSEIEKLQKEMSDKVNSMISSNVETDWDGKDNSKSPSSSSSEKDTRLEEYRQKLEELQTMLDQELINEKDFYDRSDALLNDYLKDTPAHMQKYADEISNAEKTLRGNWISSFGYEKSQLEKDLSDSTLVQWQYYEQLSELAEKYYNTEGASYGKFADEYEEITWEIKEGQEKLWDDIFSEVNSQLDNLQSACETVRDAIAEYSENGSLSIDTMQKLIALEPQYMAMLFDENGQLQLNAEAYERLAKTKLEELKIDLAGQALNTINSLQNEAQAVEMLTGKYAELRDTSAGAIEQQLRDAVGEAYGRGEKQGKAAEMVLQAYINQKKVLDATDLSSLSLTAEQKDSEADRFLKTFDWIGTLLERISDKTSKLIDKVNKFYSWQKKNSMINRAVKSADREISQNQLAYQAYMKKANAAGLELNYVRKVQNGTLSVEDITDENLSNRIDTYKEWYDKAQACLDTIEDLYDRQRDLIRQKLDNVLDYYRDMDDYLSSITSKIESVISLNDEMGKRTSLTELVEQFASVSDRLENATAKSTAANMTDAAVAEIPSGGSKQVAEAVKRDSKELADSIQAEIDNLDVTESGNYTKLLNDIAKTKAEIGKYEDKGWDKSKAKSYEKLQKKLQDYYDLQKALDENATSDTVGNYERIYKAWQKLRNKLDSGKTLSKSEQKRYDSYAGQLDDLKAQGQSSLDRLRGELAEADGTAPKQSEADRIKAEIDGIQSDLENSVTYQNLKTNIKNTENQIADFDEAGYDSLSKKQKQTYDRMQKQLKDYYAQKDALDEGATASSIAEYNRIYLARKKLQDKLDSGKNLSEGQWKQYNDYTKQLESFKKKKSDTLSGLYAAQEEALNPGDKREQIEKAYEESSKDIYESYQSQIDSINGETQNSQQYKSLKAKAQKLEQKKDTKGLSKSEQASLDKYNAELEALQTGATGANIKDYMKTWESWYALEQKLKKNGKLSDSDAKKYDDYKAKLEAWNAEKQTQINDLVSLMEDDLEQLDKTYTENISEAESEVNGYYANLYSLAKQIAEYNITSLQSQLDYIESFISYYRELISLYDSFSGEKLTKLLTDLDETELADKAATYGKYLNKLQEKYDTTLSEINEYSQLLGALREGDFESSTDLFRKAMDDYRSNGNDAMADRLQSVLDLLNERAADAGDWDAYADEWALEWENALSAARQELIGTATQIQEVNDALREIRFENITDAIEELDRASGMLSSIESLIQDDWLFEPDGSLSEYGRAKAALLVSQLEDAQAQADAYLNLYNEIQNNKDTYASDKAYRSDLNDALQNYYDSLNSAASFENSIMDLMKKSSEEEINSLKDIIEARKKALQSKKEYYDYDKSIKNSQKEIDSLKAQIDALENLSDATDAATKAKLAQLKAELAEKEDALQETKDEHTFNLQIDALDEFANSLTDSLDNSTKSVEEILKEQKEIVASTKDLCKASVDSTSEAIDRLTAFYGGMGASIDGTDYLTKASPENGGSFSIRADGSVIYPENGNNENMIVSAVNETTSAVEQLKQETADRLAALITNQELFRELIPELFSWENAIMPQLNDGISQLNKFIQTREEAQPVVINNHYDSLINVEGNVDKEVADLLPKQLEQSYLYTTEHLFNGIRAINTNRSGRPFIL